MISNILMAAFFTASLYNNEIPKRAQQEQIFRKTFESNSNIVGFFGYSNKIVAVSLDLEYNFLIDYGSETVAINDASIGMEITLSNALDSSNNIIGSTISGSGKYINYDFDTSITLDNNNLLNFEILSNDFYTNYQSTASGSTYNRIEMVLEFYNDTVSYQNGVVFEINENALKNALGTQNINDIYYVSSLPLFTLNTAFISEITAFISSDAYNSGFESATNGSFSIEWLSVIFTPLANFLMLELFPNFKFGYIFIIPAIVALVVGVLKLLR